MPEANRSQAVADAIVALRRQRLTGKHIAKETGVSPADRQPGAGTRRPVAAERHRAGRAGAPL